MTCKDCLGCLTGAPPLPNTPDFSHQACPASTVTMNMMYINVSNRSHSVICWLLFFTFKLLDILHDRRLMPVRILSFTFETGFCKNTRRCRCQFHVSKIGNPCAPNCWTFTAGLQLSQARLPAPFARPLLCYWSMAS
jgi:hypothetical protein